ncbi:NeuD/PglB/VioB family sugar acetyltransferase [Caenimonas koreensis]|uniref:NeuD/PglB/VioB family sugar acetyltransferase n=1 Tax=Caenimonas koreensis TaxID=367474 RepID=UPI002B27426A|nr:NeuD/PglB/VioB family sugar acetyltransferase [Caenimonas koreensis]
MASLLILGAGGHGRVVADAALAGGQWSRVFACDRDPARSGGDLPHGGSGELLHGVMLMPIAQAMAVGVPVHVAIGKAAHRERECAALRAGALATVTHPTASISRFATLAPGCFIAAQAVVAPGASLGTSVIVNHGVVVDHDVVVGEFSHIAPRAALGGGVSIGKRVLVGAGASVLPGIRIADDVTIGAGAVVVDHIDEPGTYAGVPARRLQ